MNQSSNGWPVLQPGSKYLHRWVIPGAERAITMRHGSAGFLLTDIALWFHEVIEPINEPGYDDWGHNVRKISGSNTYSNHASGTAIDVNATDHPYHVPVERTFTFAEINAIHRRLGRYDGCIRWGGDFNDPWVDGMHFEIVKSLKECEKVARKRLELDRGKRILNANPGQRAVILS